MVLDIVDAVVIGVYTVSNATVDVLLTVERAARRLARRAMSPVLSASRAAHIVVLGGVGGAYTTGAEARPGAASWFGQSCACPRDKG